MDWHPPPPPPKNLAPERYAAQVQCKPRFLQPYLVVPSKGGQRLRIAMSGHIAGEPIFAISIQNGHKQDGMCVQGIPTFLSEMPTECVYRAHIDMEISVIANSAPVLCMCTSCKNHCEWVLCTALKTA